MSSMRIFILFAPKFQEWPLAIMRELHRKNPEIRFCGITTGRRELFDYLQSEAGDMLDYLDHFDSLEQQWIQAEPDDKALRKFELTYGASALQRIVIADRNVGQGYITSVSPLSTPMSQWSQGNQNIEIYLTQLMQYLEEKFDKYPVNGIFCYAVAGSIALALKAISDERCLCYMRLIGARIGNQMLIDDTTQGWSLPLKRRFEQALENPNSVADTLPSAQQYIQEFTDRTATPSYALWGPTIRRKQLTYTYMLREIAAGLRRIFRHMLKPDTRRTGLREPSEWSLISSRVLHSLRGRKIIRNRKQFTPQQSLKPGQFIFFPLHVDPEASTMVLTPMTTHQYTVIEALAKSLPPSMRLAIKEHVSMLGKREPQFYESLRRIPGVELVDPFLESRWLIDNSAAVSTITGSAGWEAILLGKPLLSLGRAPYQNIGKGFVLCTDPAAMPAAVKEVLNMPPVERHRVELYIAAAYAECFEMEEDLIWGNVSKERVAKNIELAGIIADQMLTRIKDYSPEQSED